MNTIQVALDKIVEKAVPVTISWERDRILEFLSKQYSEGNPKAEELLKLQLWLDVQEKIDTGAITGENTDSQVSPTFYVRLDGELFSRRNAA